MCLSVLYPMSILSNLWVSDIYWIKPRCRLRFYYRRIGHVLTSGKLASSAFQWIVCRDGRSLPLHNRKTFDHGNLCDANRTRIVMWNPVHCGCTKHHIVHNAPICLELRSLALSKLGCTLTCSECRWRTLNRKEKLWHRAVSLWQHSFLVLHLYLLIQAEL